ncbi:MAG: ATP-dependent DNA helicase RecG (EC [uncultured Thiotrichaceae bacterium]|uniref:ATP-dependent DNA helicase RecG n=1 Tax=uncultured Thiotrichaceae bacterium TaxID=298394 RepID=A0A6S6U560_9GAMM|nr:MAG: ATP-dependent DNA helicase RecG (EC [uncultured Thiotrichaceae bacterium]
MANSALNTSLSAPVTSLKGVGPHIAVKLEKLGISQIQDLLFHLPLRYQDRTRIHNISNVTAGQEVLVEGVVESCNIVMRRRRMMICQISDQTGRMTLRFFHFSSAQQKSLATGTEIRCFGEVRQGPNMLEMVHPEYTQADNTSRLQLSDTLTASYPSTDRLQQRSLRKFITQALSQLTELGDLLPPSLQSKYQLPALNEAIKTIHEPPPEADVFALLNGQHPAQRRLIFEEMLAHHLSLRQLRQHTQNLPGMPMQAKVQSYQQLLKSLPFQLTQAQHRVIAEIHGDMQNSWPMNRLVQGDVGSGKTLVAAAAALLAIDNGYQVAIMAPTEILAEQHFVNFQTWLEPLNIQVGIVSGKQTAKEKRSQRENLQLGLSRLVVGTHALFQKDVIFQSLGLLVIDEQHRFGVDQRLALREKGKQEDAYPHQLIMTATPIPRTLAMTTCADLDYSVIDELPPGRQAITTVAIPIERRDEIIARIRGVIEEGRQVYWVCTLIEESEALQCQAAEDAFEQLKENLPTLNVGLVHGRMKPAEKEASMQAFKEAKIDLLIATTVIEVGVDVPNASLMVIENAERLGLAQLHQLRGRVGRGTAASSCVLLYQPPLSKHAHKRIDALRKSSDGFELARIDLEIRGPGEVFGTRQTGELQFRIADLMRDQVLLPDVQTAAEELLNIAPEVSPQLIKRWINRAEEYSNV